MTEDGKTRIRFADGADAAVIARIHMASRAAAMPYLPPQKRGHEQVTRWVLDVLLRECRIWVAVRGAEIVGYAALDGDMLEHLYLRPDVRRQGIGTLLLDEVRRHSPDGVSLHVFQQNTDARVFYERHGFTVFDTSDGDRNMENLPDMTLRWTPDSAHRGVDDATRANRAAWEAASVKHVREYDELLAQAASGSSLTEAERDLLAPVLREAPEVVHLQSGHGLDDVALVRAGARSVVGVDYSRVAAGAAQRRAHELGVPCRYVVGEVPAVPLAGACADLVYTGKGALIWMPDLTAWACCAARLLRPEGHLFVYEEHPAAPLWTWDEDRPRIREDRDYFGRSHVNDTFPAHGAVQWQSTLGQVVTAVASAGLQIVHLGEYAEPFWRTGGVSAAAWNGRLPNAYALLARLPG